MGDYSHKERSPARDVAAWLTAHHKAPVSELAPVRGGYWSSAWSYHSGDRDLLLRVGENDDGYRIDKAAEAFVAVGIPVPRVLYIGEALGKAAAISRRHVGSFVEEAEVRDAVDVGNALTGLLMRMRTVSPREVEWHRTVGGARSWRSWLARELRLATITDRAWSSACDTHAELKRTRDHATDAILGGLPQCPERRDLIHRDLLHQNVLIEHGAVTGIFSWKHSLFGDFLYDVAACSLWGAWHPAVAAADIWNRILAEASCHDLIDAEHRHRMYQLHIAVEHLYWYVNTGSDAELARLLGVMKPLLA